MSYYAIYGAIVAMAACVYAAETRGFAPRALTATAYAALGLAMIAAMWWMSDPQNFLSDFEKAYYSAGKSVIDGETGGMYDANPLNFVNVPIVAWLFVPIAMLPETYAGILWTVAGVVAVAAALVGLLTLAGLYGRPAWGMLAVTIACGPLYNSLREGNATHFILLGLVVALWCARTDRDGTLGFVLTAVIVLKPPLVILLVPFVFRHGTRVVAWCAGALAALGALSLAAFGIGMHRTWFDATVLEFSRHPLAAANVQSADGFVARLYDGGDNLYSWVPIETMGPEFFVLRVLLIGVIAGAAALVWARARVPADDRALRLELCTLLCLSLVLGPITWTHYYTLLLIPVALILSRDILLSGRRWWVAAACAVALMSPPEFAFRTELPVLDRLVPAVFVSHYFYGGVVMLAVLLMARVSEARRWRAGDAPQTTVADPGAVTAG